MTSTSNRKPLVFLGGTCNDSEWRARLIPLLAIDFFNPQLPPGTWDKSDEIKEVQARQNADYVLYVLTPRGDNLYSIAEVVEDAIKSPKRTVFCFLTEDGDKEFTLLHIRAMQAVGRIAERNGATVCKNLMDVANVLNALPAPLVQPAVTQAE